MDTLPHSETLNPMFMSIIGIVRCLVKVGRVNIATEVSRLSLLVACATERTFSKYFACCLCLKIKYTSSVDPGFYVSRD